VQTYEIQPLTCRSYGAFAQPDSAQKGEESSNATMVTPIKLLCHPALFPTRNPKWCGIFDESRQYLQIRALPDEPNNDRDDLRVVRSPERAAARPCQVLPCRTIGRAQAPNPFRNIPEFVPKYHRVIPDNSGF
jgi:hypothetical protein